MKNRQTRIIMGIMVGLILFSSSIALLMYSKQSKLKEMAKEQIEVYVSARYLTIGDKISPQDIQKAFLPKSYIDYTPLTQSEIVGRYANVDIFSKEPIRKGKISITPPVVNRVEVSAKKETLLKAQHNMDELDKDTISIPTILFKNIDSTLKEGDFIDIISVFPKKMENEETKFTTKYIAIHVPVHSFVVNGIHQHRYITKVDAQTTLKADEITFEMNSKNIKNLLALYYKTQELNLKRVHNKDKTNEGHLWIVKCATKPDAAEQARKKRLLLDHVVVHKRRSLPKKSVSISYED